MIKITKDGVVTEVVPRHLKLFLGLGWTEVSDSTPKKVSKAKLVAEAEIKEQPVEEPVVFEEPPQHNPPQE